MDEKEQAIDRKIQELLQDPVVVKEVKAMRDRGLSERYVQNWLRQIALLQR